MADDGVRETIVTEFFLHTCLTRGRMDDDDVHAVLRCARLAKPQYRRADGVEYGYVPLITGSVAELYVEPMLSCVGDVDIMCHRSSQLAKPAGQGPPARLPGEFGSRVLVYEVVDSEFPGYVYLRLSHLLTESVDDGEYIAEVPCERLLATNGNSYSHDANRHGPALTQSQRFMSGAPTASASSYREVDDVFCMRCLSWPLQAADWPTRRRNCGWPDSATVDRVVGDGCDVVGVAHRQCRQDEWTRKHQWRLSFSRAEIVLLNSWIPVQQIVYHMLRFFWKRLPDNANNAEPGTLNSYHIKTLMLWACELKSASWWTDDLNLVRICVSLLHTLAGWLTDACCQHYFINYCNLFYQFENSRSVETVANQLMSISRQSFCG